MKDTLSSNRANNAVDDDKPGDGTDNPDDGGKTGGG